MKKKKLTKPISVDEASTLLKENYLAACDSKAVVQNFTVLLTRIQDKSPDQKLKILKQEQELVCNASSIYNLDNQSLLVYSAGESYRTFATSFARDLIDEYKCTTASEKALVQMITDAFIRVLKVSRQFNNSMAPDHLSSNRAGYLNSLSKELDRANRQFNTSLQTLKQMKQPPLQVNFNTKNAFIAQHQQFNDNQRQDVETITP